MAETKQTTSRPSVVASGTGKHFMPALWNTTTGIVHTSTDLLGGEHPHRRSTHYTFAVQQTAVMAVYPLGQWKLLSIGAAL